MSQTFEFLLITLFAFYLILQWRKQIKSEKESATIDAFNTTLSEIFTHYQFIHSSLHELVKKHQSAITQIDAAHDSMKNHFAYATKEITIAMEKETESIGLLIQAQELIADVFAKQALDRYTLAFDTSVIAVKLMNARRGYKASLSRHAPDIAKQMLDTWDANIEQHIQAIVADLHKVLPPVTDEPALNESEKQPQPQNQK